MNKIIKKNKLMRIIKFINYIYINYYVVNSLKIDSSSSCSSSCSSSSSSSSSCSSSSSSSNEWKIFSTCSNDESINYEQFNILHLIQSIMSRDEFDYDVLLISIHIYRKICIEYAHLIENYIYLFGSVYISMNKILCEKFLCEKFLSDLFDKKLCLIKKMVWCIDKFINYNDIYFGLDEKDKIINEIQYL